MSTRKFTKKRPTPTLTPEQKTNARLRARAERALRKRRKDKSHQ